MTFYFGDILPYLPQLLKALWISVYVTLISFAVGSVLGVFVYLAKTGRVGVLRTLATAYIEVFRNTPLLVQLYLIYFGLPQIGLNFNPVWATVIAMVLNNSAYTSEIFRAGFESIPVGLREAGAALGMSFRQIFRYIVFKPAVRNVLPALTNQLIVLFLFSSVGSFVSLGELTDIMRQLNSQTQRTLEVFTYAAVLYYLSSVVIALASRVGERVLFRW